MVISRRHLLTSFHGHPPAIRSYVLAFSAQGTVAKDQTVCAGISNYLAQVGDAHLHGVLIAGSAL
jgi:hypothetical protein